jgi:hypothetical protein
MPNHAGCVERVRSFLNMLDDEDFRQIVDLRDGVTVAEIPRAKAAKTHFPKWPVGEKMKGRPGRPVSRHAGFHFLMYAQVSGETTQTNQNVIWGKPLTVKSSQLA